MTVKDSPGAAMVPGEKPGQVSSPRETAVPGDRPPVIEGPGRYVVFEAPDGGWVVARAVGICETCQRCGCGEQADPIQVPGMVVKLAQSQGNGKLLGRLKGMTGRG